jgi:hypothetical protein
MAASLASSMAQNVYSLNVVGYYNITVAGGAYTLCANQLNAGANSIGEVLPTPPDDALVLTFASGSYSTDIAAGGAWYDYNSAEPSTTVLAPGKGWFYNNPGATTTLTMVGEVPQGQVNVALPANYGLVGTYTPQALELSAANGFPIADDMLHLSFNGNYTISIAAGGSWYDYNSADPVTIIPAVGQGYFINNPGAATTWARTFTVQ